MSYSFLISSPLTSISPSNKIICPNLNAGSSVPCSWYQSNNRFIAQSLRCFITFRVCSPTCSLSENHRQTTCYLFSCSLDQTQLRFYQNKCDQAQNSLVVLQSNMIWRKTTSASFTFIATNGWMTLFQKRLNVGANVLKRLNSTTRGVLSAAHCASGIGDVSCWRHRLKSFVCERDLYKWMNMKTSSLSLGLNLVWIIVRKLESGPVVRDKRVVVHDKFSSGTLKNHIMNLRTTIKTHIFRMFGSTVKVIQTELPHWIPFQQHCLVLSGKIGIRLLLFNPVQQSSQLYSR